MWLLLQGLIIFAVVASNIHWHWTPNGLLAALIGVGAAFLFTVTCNGLARVLARARQARLARRGAHPAERPEDRQASLEGY